LFVKPGNFEVQTKTAAISEHTYTHAPTYTALKGALFETQRNFPQRKEKLQNKKIL
jgi:hypothetical protein